MIDKCDQTPPAEQDKSVDFHFRLSKKVVGMAGCALLFLAAFGSMWTFGKPTKAGGESPRFGLEPQKVHNAEIQAVGPRSALSPDEIFTRSSPAVVQVAIQDQRGRTIGTGSGFLVGTKGLVVTNYHVIAKAYTANVAFPNKRKLSVAGVAAADEDVDIAIIKVAGQVEAQPLELVGNDLPAIGTKVYAIGNPLDLTTVLSDGLVSAHRENHGIAEIMTTAPISPGSSGGPLLGADAKVVGVTTAFFKGGQNLNVAIPASHVARLLLLCEGDRQLTRFPLASQNEQGISVPVLSDTGRRVQMFKDKLRRGLEPPQVRAFAGIADKTEYYRPGDFIADFKFRVPNGGTAVVARRMPFEVPGVTDPRYRANFLFVGNGAGQFQLQNWYFRSPN